MSRTPLLHPVILRRAFRLLRGLATLAALAVLPVMVGWALADAFTSADTLTSTLRAGFGLLGHVLSSWHAGHVCN